MLSLRHGEGLVDHDAADDHRITNGGEEIALQVADAA
jgi:hypothetical protein